MQTQTQTPQTDACRHASHQAMQRGLTIGFAAGLVTMFSLTWLAIVLF